MLRKYDVNIWKHIEVAYDRAQLLAFVLAVLKLRVLLAGTEKDRYRLILYLVQQGQRHLTYLTKGSLLPILLCKVYIHF
jgi:hypothetical protein